MAGEANGIACENNSAENNDSFFRVFESFLGTKRIDD